MSAEELAKLAQNPVGNLISVPFQNNTNLNSARKGHAEHPQHPAGDPDLDQQDWNIITRTIIPVISMPSLGPVATQRQRPRRHRNSPRFLSPANPGKWIWGLGAVGAVAHQHRRDARQRQLGPGANAVVLHLEKGSPWVYGALVNNIWSLSSNKQGGSLQQRPDSAVSQLQLSAGWPLPDQRTDSHRRIGRRRTANAGRCRWAAAWARSSTWASCR